MGTAQTSLDGTRLLSDCSGRDKRGFARLARALLLSERAVRASDQRRSAGSEATKQGAKRCGRQRATVARGRTLRSGWAGIEQRGACAAPFSERLRSLRVHRT